MKKLFTLCFALCLALGLSAQVVLSEDFSLVTDSTSSSIANSINTYTQTTGWTADWVYPCTGKIKIGKSTAGGFIQTPALDLSANNGQFVVSFDAEAWYNDNTHIKIIIDGVEYTVDGLENDGSYGSYTHFEMPFAGGTSATTVRFESYVASKGRFFIDNIVITSQAAGPDVTAPFVASVTPSANAVAVHFNEVLDATSAQNVANYSLDNNINITSATLAGSVVTLAVSPALTEGTTYALTVNNIADTAGNTMSSASTTNFTFGVAPEFQCANIAALRSKLDFSDNSANTADNTEYKLTGEVIVTAVASYNNQKMLQDATGAILVYDPDGKLGSLEVGDKVSGIYGTLTSYYGFLEFKPTKAYETFVDIYQDVTPLEISLAQLNDQTFMSQHQGELIKMNDVTFNDAGTFAVLNVYSISQGGNTNKAVYPYFQDANYVGNDIPTTSVNLLGVNFATSKVGNTYPEEGFRYYIVPRFNSDFVTTSINEYNNTVAVYPNPATDMVRFDVNEPVASAIAFDINGKMMYNDAVENNTINVSSFNSGIYFVRLLDGNKQLMGTAKIVKY